MEKTTNAYKILVVKPHRRRPQCRSENITMERRNVVASINIRQLWLMKWAWKEGCGLL